MSYDLMVFDLTAVPIQESEFLEWYEKNIGSEVYGFERNPDVSTPPLRAWFLEMITKFGAMNGPYKAISKLDSSQEAYETEYVHDRNFIIAAFAWSLQDEAFSKTLELALKHRLGVFEICSESFRLWVPSHDDREMVLAK